MFRSRSSSLRLYARNSTGPSSLLKTLKIGIFEFVDDCASSPGLQPSEWKYSHTVVHQGRSPHSAQDKNGLVRNIILWITASVAVAASFPLLLTIQHGQLETHMATSDCIRFRQPLEFNEYIHDS